MSSILYQLFSGALLNTNVPNDLTSAVLYYTVVKSVKLIMFIWKPTQAIIRVTKTYRSASR